ncbi:hypothetical protein PHET_03421 [Paragonimus heterotremus]|uniref:Uncharacterized protein n=1 Tax=Paragonimus heterotremus TaxID=100268 RepID=A0A8J4SR71_9TREM|nr:hypothetical protein PHET_03421 [Paragonimus heterotremus]
MQPKDAQHTSDIPENGASVMTTVMEALNLICWNVAGASWWIDTSRVKMAGDVDYWLRVPAPVIIPQEHIRSTGERIIGRLRVLRYGQSVCVSGIKLTPQQPRERIYVETIHSDTGGHWKVLWTDCNQHLILHSNNRGQTHHLVKKVPVQLGPDIHMNGWVSGRMCNSSDKTAVMSRTLTYNWCFIIPLPIDCLSYVTVLLSPPQITQTTPCVRTTPPTHVHDPTNECSTQFDNDDTMCCLSNTTRVNQTTFINRQIQTAFNNLDSNSKISTDSVKPLNLINSSCLAAVLPLFDPETRLTMLMQEVHPFRFASNHHSSGHRSRSVEQLFTAHSCSSYTSIEAARSESPAADQPNCYTYIRTKEGLPAYTNGASISPKKSSTDDTYPSLMKSTYYQADRSINTVPSSEPRSRNIFRNSSQSLEHLKNESWSLRSNPIVSKTYMLKQLEVISSPESIPPPWMTKLHNTRTFWRQSSERSWSTIGTPDSGPHPDDEILPTHTEEDLSLGVDHQIDSEQSLSSECMQLGQPATHSRSVSSEHVSQPRRISLLIEILSELNVLAEQVLTHHSEDVFDDSESSNLFDYPLISDRCKQILSKLSVLCEDGEEEELPDSDLHTTETRLCSSRVPVVPKSESALSAICYPLPLHSRIGSSTRLLVCYFEILSELADLQAEQRKDVVRPNAVSFKMVESRPTEDSEVNQLTILWLTELSSERRNVAPTALLRLFNTPPRLEQARDLQAEQDSCNTGLQVLFSLRDLIRMDPGILDWRSTVLGTPARSIAEAKRIMDMCITQIETAIEEHLEWLKRLVEQESRTEQKRLTCRTIWNDGRSYLDQVEWLKKFKEFDTGLTEGPTEGDHDLLDFTKRSSCLETHLMGNIPTDFSSRTLWAKMISECTLELPYLERYLHEPWLPVQKWRRVDSKDQLVQNLSDWHIAQVDSWKETTEFLKISVQETIRYPGEQFCRLYSYLALDHQLRAEDTLHNCLAMELTIQQLQYQICIEGSSLSALFKRFNQVPSGSNPGSTWLGLWIDRLTEAYESVVHLWELRVKRRRQHALVQSFEAWIVCAEKCLDGMAQRSELHSPKELLAKSNTSVSLIWSLICEAQVLHEVAWRVQQCNLDSENTCMTLVAEKMNTCLRKLNRHLELVVSACQHDSTLVPELLYKLEQSLRESRTSEVQTLACIAMNDGISVTDPVSNTDKLRTLVYTLRNCHLYWERRLRLTQRAITIAGSPQFATSPQVTQFVQRWTASMCLRRDWQMKLCHGLNRLIRAGQLVDAERFPLRPLHTIETRLDPEEMLRQEQVFLESIRFALDALHTESGILREALSLCDSQATTSPMALSLNGTMEELKHLLTRMLHDPRLGQSCSLKMPRDKFTTYIQTRVTEGDRLYALIKLAIRTQWELVGLEERMPESDCLNQRLAQIETALKLNQKAVRNSRLKRLSLLSAKWDQWNLKYEPVNFSQYTAGFAWTPISFSSNSIQIPVVTEESVELMVVRYRQLRNRLFNTLEKLNSEAGHVEDARVVRFKIVPDELPNWRKIGCTCNSDKITEDDLETNFLQNKATDIFKHANLLRDLYSSLDLHSSQHAEIYTKSVQKTLELCLLLLSRSDRNLQLVTFFRQSADKLRSIGVNDLKHDDIARAIEQLNELTIEVRVFDGLSTKQDQVSRPSWLVVLVASLKDLVDCLPAGVGLCSSSTCFGSNVMRVLYQVETQLNSDIGSMDSKTLPAAWFHKQLSLTDWLLVSNPHFTGDLKTERDIKNRILQARCQLDAVDHWTETIRLVQSKLEELALPSVCWKHFGRFELELFTKLTMVERCCIQTKRRLSESALNIPLSLPELEINNNGRSDEDAIAYSRDLLKQLIRCLYNRARMRDCIGRTCEQAEKLRDLISTM